MHWLLLAYYVLVGIPCLVVMLASIYVLWHYRDQSSWPATRGQLNELDVVLKSGYRKRHWEVIADFNYEVNHQEYECSGKVISVFISRKAAQNLSDQIDSESLKEGSISVFYNPQSPDTAILVRESHWYCWLFIALAVMMLALPIGSAFV